MPFFVTRQVYCGAGKVGTREPRPPVRLPDLAARGLLRDRGRARHDGEAADHQHARRAARRSREVPPPARDRRRRQPVRVHDLPAQRRDRDRARDDRGRRDHQEPLAARPGAGDQGGLARPDAASTSSRSTTASAAPRSQIQAEYLEMALALRRPSSRSTRSRRTCWRSGSTSLDALRARSDGARREDRLGDEEGDDRALHGAQGARLELAPGADARPPVPRPSSREGSVLSSRATGSRASGSSPTRRSSRAVHTAAGGHARVFPRASVCKQYGDRGVRRQLGLDLVRGRQTSRSSAS